VQDWKESAPPSASVYSFEQFKRETPPPNPTAIIIDEADCMASPLYLPRLRSQRTEKMYEYVMANPDAHVLLLTATPVRSSPANMHTLLVLARKIPATKELWKRYQSKYYELKHMPYLPRPAWMPIDTWRKDMQRLITKYTYTACMSDIVTLPPVTSDKVSLKPPSYTKNPEWEPMAEFVYNHRAEQESKPAEILRIAKGYRKVVVVAHFTEQINTLKDILSKDRAVYVLDGRTKDMQKVVKDANDDPECFFLVQASIGAGFELPSFAVMVFASMGYSVRNAVQMRGRILRINALKPVRYVYLLGGKCDRAILKNIEAGMDFVPAHFLQHDQPDTETP
jgi:superfamily II DNA or RNA helicase